MADFINTIDVLGDEAVVDSIIERTITEFNDNRITSIGYRAFYKCADLKAVNCPAVTEITAAGAFEACKALEYADFPNLTSVQREAFYECRALKRLNAPNITAIPDYMVRNCAALESADFPLATNIGGRAFESSPLLTRLCFPKVETANTVAVTMCNNLRELDLPSAKTLNNRAFINNSSLVALILRPTTMCTTDYDPVSGTPIASGTGYIYVPRALVDGYKSATNWSTYAAQFRALEDYTVDGTITGALDETKI